MTLSSYIHAAMSSAQYKILEDRTYFGEIHGFQGVWASEKNLEKCRHVLQEVLEEWIVLKLRDREPLPSAT
ncbi:MAG: type II toxin-antitoxin system HicB family antitoxin [Elusimicrobia bacterium]|nr:type II toxin-antitoxin system HicB family antitoxin [Elusimicrobiota bacterium]